MDNTANMPRWFRLEAYDGGKQWDAQTWGENLAVRAWMHSDQFDGDVDELANRLRETADLSSDAPRKSYLRTMRPHDGMSDNEACQKQ